MVDVTVRARKFVQNFTLRCDSIYRGTKSEVRIIQKYIIQYNGFIVLSLASNTKRSSCKFIR